MHLVVYYYIEQECIKKLNREEGKLADFPTVFWNRILEEFSDIVCKVFRVPTEKVQKIPTSKYPLL